MWKEGFEASPLSPAGELQRYGAFFDGLRSGSVRSRKAIAVVLGAVLILVLIALIYGRRHKATLAIQLQG
jgi:high-affinity Fe2+/Pb2+ permease